MNFILMLIMSFMSVAFFTILERKMLGSFHIRLGPNKTGIWGIFQPFYDALKLFNKNLNMISKINELFWNLSPILLFILFMIIINFLPVKMENNNIHNNIFLIIIIIGLSIFPMMFSSFFSFSKFSIISMKRCFSQMISYEMGFMMTIIMMIPLINEMNIMMMSNYINNFNFMKILTSFLFYIIILGETSRIPFDFIEGESELVSGFNIEFSSSYFSLFFIYEYGMMMFFSVFISFLFNKFIYCFIFMFLFILIRACFPRMRYDQMMMFYWKYFYLFLTFLIMLMKL